MGSGSFLESVLIDRTAAVPPFYQLQETIRRWIADGRLAPGDRLPPVREAAEKLGLSQATVMRALRDLVREGVLESRSRQGMFVREVQFPATEILTCLDPSNFPLNQLFVDQMIRGLCDGLGEPSRACPLSMLDAERTTAREILSVCQARRADSLLAYRPPSAILPALRQVAEHIPTVSLVYPIPDAPVDCVFIDPDEALRQVLQDFLRRGKRVFAFAAWQQQEAQWESPACPYARMRRVFHRTLSEAGVEALEFLSNAERVEEARREIQGAAAGLPDGAVIVGVPSGVPSWLVQTGAGFDLITYSESADSLARRRQDHTVLFMDMETCTRAAGKLLRDRIDSRAVKPGRTVTLHPEIHIPERQKGGN